MDNFAYERYNYSAKERQPRERMAIHGIGVLSDLELICLMLGSGNSKKNVYQLAREVLQVLDGEPDMLNLDNLRKIPGIGLARAGVIAGSLEFARRRLKPDGKQIGKPSDVYPMLIPWADRPQEFFLVISLNGAHEVIKLRVVSQGILNQALVHPREVFAAPLAERAAAIICAHNHPSGSLEISKADVELTLRLKKSGDLLGIPMLDHLIFTVNGFVSFVEKNKM